MNGTAPPQTVAASANEASTGAVLDGLTTFRHRWWAPILLGVIMLFDSWDSIAIAYAMPAMSAEWRLNPLTMGFLLSAGYGGQFVGALLLGVFAERYGRMPVILVAATVMGVLALACAIVRDYTALLAVRLVQGVMIGGALPVAITYINELAATKTRGRYFALFHTLAMSGFAASSIASTFVIPHLGWRWLLGLGAFPIILLPLVWITLPESPRWLARTGRLARANKALAKLGGAGVNYAEPIVAAAAQTEQKASPKPTSLTLLSSPLRARTLTITLLWFLTMFANFGLTTWVPSIYVTVYHIPLAAALRYSAVTSISFLLMTPIIGVLMDKFGRRPLAGGGAALASLALIALAILRPTQAASLVPLVVVGHLAISICVVILWPFTAETYPTHARALAVGYGSSIGRCSSMLMPIFVGFVLNKGAPIAIVFAIFGLCSLGAFAVWSTRTVETAGRSLDTA